MVYLSFHIMMGFYANISSHDFLNFTELTTIFGCINHHNQDNFSLHRTYITTWYPENMANWLLLNVIAF